MSDKIRSWKHIRKRAVDRWVAYIEKAEGKKPTNKEYHTFVAGFNMGWKARKFKSSYLKGTDECSLNENIDRVSRNYIGIDEVDMT